MCRHLLLNYLSRRHALIEINFYSRLIQHCPNGKAERHTSQPDGQVGHHKVPFSPLGRKQAHETPPILGAFLGQRPSQFRLQQKKKWNDVRNSYQSL